MRKKDDKVGNKTGYRKKGKWKKKRFQKKNWNRFEKLTYVYVRKTKKLLKNIKCLITSNKKKIMSLLLEISFSTIPMLGG